MATSNDWDDVNSWNDSDEWNDFMTTFIGLTDTPNQYGANQRRFLQVSGESDVIIFNDIELNTLIDVQSTGPDAPTVGDVLTWTADNHWRPVSNDPYSAGNGLSKTGGTLNVVAGIDGGLTANASGIFLTTIANVSGTYGNATYVPQFTVNDKGQITAIDVVEGSFAVAESLNASYVGNISGTAGAINVTGGTGINSNATISLVATGVTAGTYGNATYSPVITVDTYGRIQNVDLVENIGGGGGNGNVDLSTVTTEAFKSIAVAGQTTVSADTKDDTLTFVAGTGMQITTTAGTDTITFSTNISTNQITDIDATGATEGQALVYDAGNAIFKPGTVAGSGGGASVTVSDTAPVGASNGDLWWRSDTGKLKIYYDDGTSQQWVDASPASSNSANYSDGTIILPTNQTPDTSEGSITWDPVADTLYVGDGSSAVAITGSSYGDVQVQAYLDAQGYSNVSYGNVEVQSYLDAQGYSNVDLDAQTLTWDEANTALSITGGNTVTITGFSNYADSDVNNFLTANGYSNTVVSYSNATVQSYLDAQGYSNVDSDSQTLTWDAANVNLAISGGNDVTLFDQSLDTTDTVTFTQVNTEDVTGANQLILSAGASGITASTNGNQQFNATSGSIFLVTPTVDAQTSAFLANTITANALTVNGQAITAYGNTEVQTYLDAQGYSNVDLDAQTLTWDSANSNISISGGNTVTLTGVGGGITAVVDDTTPQLGGNLDINSKFIAGALIPDTNNTYDLGTAELKWRDLYLNSGSIYLGDVVLSTVANVLQANVEGTLKNVSFGGDPVVTSSVKPATTNAEAVDGTVTNVTGGNADGINSTGGDLVIDGGVGAIGNGSIKIGTVSTAAVDIGGATTTTTINGQTTFTNDARFDTGVEERFSTINGATGTVVHDCDNGHVFRHTSPSANWTANFTNLGLTTSYATTVTLVIDQGVTARIPTAVQIGGVAQTLLWQGGSPPTGTSNGEDVVSFSILRRGASAYTVLGQLVGFS